MMTDKSRCLSYKYSVVTISVRSWLFDKRRCDLFLSDMYQIAISELDSDMYQIAI